MGSNNTLVTNNRTEQNRTIHSARCFLRLQQTVLTFVIYCNVFSNVVYVMFWIFVLVKGQKNKERKEKN